MDKFIGKRLDGRYEFEELIGIGGMANVYRAKDVVEDRYVAIKILKEEFLGNEEFVRRFRNESKAVASLSHPNIVRIYDVNFGDKIQYIVMEYIDGITLKEFIEKAGVLSWKDTVHFTVQILRALQHAHDKGIVHRDVKPQNMMLLQDGTIKVMDFGIARFARDETKSQDKAIGSVHYISPEQASGSVTDAKSDIYSAGIMMYEMLTGQLPFDGETPEEVAVKQIQSQAKSLGEFEEMEIPKGLEEIVTRAMQKGAGKRYQSAAEMLRDIDEFKKDPSISFEYKYFDDGGTKYFDTQDEDDEDVKIAGDGNKKPKPKKKKMIPILMGIAGGVMLVAIIMVCIFTFGGNKNVEDIELPNFVGVKFTDVKTMDDGKYSKLEFKVTEEPSNEFEAGVIIKQSPSAGVKVKSNYNDMKITVSTGPQKVNVPDVSNMPLADAQSKLKAAGFKNITTTEQDNAEITEGYVISTNPKRGTQAKTDTKITIYYSNGKGKKVNVPNVVGKDEASGKAALKAAGFDVKVQYKDSSEEKGKIIDQEPTGKVEEGSTITIDVSNGKKSSRTANVSVPLNANPPVSGTFQVVITNTSNGKVVVNQTYSVGGTVAFTDSGSSKVSYSVKITNTKTGISASYGTVSVDYTNDTPSVSTNLDSSAFSQTVKDESRSS